jgi:hypothetical protein
MANRCPFCGEPWKTETYKKKNTRSYIVFCGNDECPVQPCTDDCAPSAALRDAEVIGKIELGGDLH